jgi:hypothetical protein
MDSSDLAVIVASTVLGVVTVALAAVLAGGRCRARLPCARGCCGGGAGTTTAAVRKPPTPSRWAPLARLVAALTRVGQPVPPNPALVPSELVHVAVNVARTATAPRRRPFDSPSREDDDGDAELQQRRPGAGSSSTSAGSSGGGNGGGAIPRPPAIITTTTSPAAAPQQPRHTRPEELDLFARRRRRGPRPPRLEQPAPPGTALKPAGGGDDSDGVSSRVTHGGLSTTMPASFAALRPSLAGARREASARRLTTEAAIAVANPVAGALVRSGSRRHGIGLSTTVSAIVLHPLHVAVTAAGRRHGGTAATAATITRRTAGTSGGADSRGTTATASVSAAPSPSEAADIAACGLPPHARRGAPPSFLAGSGASAAAVACLQPPVLSPVEWASPPAPQLQRSSGRPRGGGGGSGGAFVGAAASLPAYDHRHMLPPRRPSLEGGSSGSGSGTSHHLQSAAQSRQAATLVRIAASLDAGAAVDAGSRGSAVGAFCAIDGRSEEPAAPLPLPHLQR